MSYSQCCCDQRSLTPDILLESGSELRVVSESKGFKAEWQPKTRVRMDVKTNLKLTICMRWYHQCNLLRDLCLMRSVWYHNE